MAKKKKKYKSNSHCKYLLKIHMIFCCKYRKKLLANQQVDEDMKQILFDIANESDFKIDMMESDGDHIHLLIDYPPTLSVSSIANRIKSMSTNRIWKMRQLFLSRHFWKEHTFWSDGYFACSTGDVSTETIKRYIEEQG